MEILKEIENAPRDCYHLFEIWKPILLLQTYHLPPMGPPFIKTLAKYATPPWLKDTCFTTRYFVSCKNNVNCTYAVIRSKYY